MRNKLVQAVILGLLISVCSFAVESVEYSILTDISVNESAPSITVSWPVWASATSINVYRKLPSETNWGSPIYTASNASTDTGFTDNSVSIGTVYEYRIDRAPTGDGYVLAGIKAPIVDDRGTVVLIVEEGIAASCSAELDQLELDLIGDGWRIIRNDVAVSETVPNVKTLIVNAEAGDPDVNTVFLFGHVPVPYSGNINPDGHTNHVGAWPADVYYADLDGTWTDTSVNNTSAADTRNHNIPGDGKFDQSYIPSDADLCVGRVDLQSMTSWTETEAELLQAYLSKDHNWRFKTLTAQKRGLIDDNFKTYSEDFAASGWRNFAPLAGGANVSELDWFTTLASNDYLFAYGCGGGSNDWTGGVGGTSNFAATDCKAIFTFLFGSYFGDWDKANNILRAPLASGDILTCAWAGRPHWFIHHMGMGETIGHSTRLTQNNSSSPYTPTGYGGRMVHVALMGDPTLRLHQVAPVTNLVPSLSGTDYVLNWTASPDASEGYHVYRAASLKGDYTRLTTNPTASTAYTDTNAAGTHYYYMVRAIKLENGSGGTYYNASQGVFSDIDEGGNAAPTIDTAASAAPSPVTGTSTVLSVLGADDGGESALTYTWATTGTPPAAVSFGGNASNAAKNCTATFSAAGDYDFQVTVRDTGGLTVTDTVSVTVNQTLTAITVTPASVTVETGNTQQFTDYPEDQFGDMMSVSVSWSVSGGGSIDGTGLFTAGSVSGGPYTVTASSGGVDGTASVTVFCDADGDGMDDTWESNNGLDPGDPDDADLDPDGDNLTNLDEYLNDTDPQDGDTDNDTMPDGWEVENNLDPNDDTDALNDSDGDGLTNVEEFTNGSDPDLLDSDGDLYSDKEEVDNGTDPADPHDHPAVLLYEGKGGCTPSSGSPDSALFILLSVFGIALIRTKRT